MKVTKEMRKLLEEMEFTTVEPTYDSDHRNMVNNKWNDQCRKLKELLYQNYK